MTKEEYEYIQFRLTEKLPEKRPWQDFMGRAKQKEGYREAVLACKSIISSIYWSQKKLLPTPQMIAEANCDGICHKCSGVKVCWKDIDK